MYYRSREVEDERFVKRFRTSEWYECAVKWEKSEVTERVKGGGKEEERREVEEGGEVRNAVDSPRSLYESRERTDSSSFAESPLDAPQLE